MKKKYDNYFKIAFAGVRDKKIKFKDKLISKEEKNKAELKDYDYLKNKAQTLFNDIPTTQNIIPNLVYETLLHLESSAKPRLRRKS